ncbi:dephospho-CoA kinase [Alkalisalibacterium limincola]|uniref:Dephospho-CoA kinase n=1 Tax=Alkalisalibacterium limincola TaxID=2699169 RepID=A0A5C8KYX4_9GAMM|nr:dephospho-CoA kinase [Alkalisalibacterium limincola]TXK65023.1 dephospho-CoA kinase [Alkalisalibacterium limincola]
MAAITIALTGGVASGKTQVARRFNALGVTVADADALAHALVMPGQPALDEVVARFGPEVLDAAGRLDRARMRARVFADASARRDLEAILHPRIRAAMRASCEAAPSPYAVADIPLLAEGGGQEAYPWLARVLVVDVPREVQVARLLERDGIDAALAQRMLDAQASREQRLAIADDVIENSGALGDLDMAVMQLHQRYLQLAATAGEPAR